MATGREKLHFLTPVQFQGATVHMSVGKFFKFSLSLNVYRGLCFRQAALCELEDSVFIRKNINCERWQLTPHLKPSMAMAL